MEEGTPLVMVRAFPRSNRYMLGIDYVDEEDVQALVAEKLIAPASAKDWQEWAAQSPTGIAFHLTDRARDELAGRPGVAR